MYQIYADGRLLHDPRHSSMGLVVESPKVNLEVNKVGSCTFTVLPTHPLYSSLLKLKTIIQVFDDDEEIFRGRVLNDDIDFYNKKSITCEGELAYLNDSICGILYGDPGATYDSVEQWLSLLLGFHNGTVFGVGGDDEKTFTLGEVSDFGNHVPSEQTDPGVTTWSIIESDFINNYGGFIRLRREDGVRYFDYVDDLNQYSSQVIEFGKNLLDLSQHITAENLFTRLFPYGANKNVHLSTDQTKPDLGLVLESELGISLFGRITKAHQWPWVTADVGNPDAILRVLGEQYLSNSLALSVSIDVSGYDLTNAGIDTDKIHVGDKVRTVSKPHGLDQFFLCSSITYDLSNPGNNEYSFGFAQKALTDKLITG